MFIALLVVRKSVCFHALYPLDDDASGTDSSTLWVPETLTPWTKRRASQVFSTKLPFLFLANYIFSFKTFCYSP